MKKIILALNELKRAIVHIKVMEALLDTILGFFLAYLVMVLVAKDWRWALLPAIVFGIVQIHRKVNELDLKDVEYTVPQLREQLRASADNVYKDNEISESLHADVLNLMKQIRTSAFVPFKKIWREIMTIAALSFCIILLSALNVRLIDFDSVLDNLKKIRESPADIKLQENQLDTLPVGDLYGNASVAALGNKELMLQINPVLSEINLEDIKEAKPKDYTEHSFPSEILAKADKSFEENIPKENKEIVKRYFGGISKAK